MLLNSFLMPIYPINLPWTAQKMIQKNVKLEIVEPWFKDFSDFERGAGYDLLSLAIPCPAFLFVDVHRVQSTCIPKGIFAVYKINILWRIWQRDITDVEAFPVLNQMWMQPICQVILPSFALVCLSLTMGVSGAMFWCTTNWRWAVRASERRKTSLCSTCKCRSPTSITFWDMITIAFEVLLFFDA